MASSEVTAGLDPVRQLLLSRISGQGAGAGGMSLPDMIEQRLGDDPIAAPLAAALRQRLARPTAEPETIEMIAEKDAVDEFGPADDHDAIAVLHQMYAELEVLRERNDLLAHALGACPHCWGEDKLCPRCHGRGRPGARRPDQAAFRELILPAIQRHAPLSAPASSPSTSRPR